MKKLILVVLLAFIPNLMHSQISKGDYLLGGSIYLGYVDGNYFNGSDNDNRQFSISLNPSAGYFIKDKFAIGTSLSYNFNYNIKNNSSYHGLAIGPYLKYYFLEKERNVNVFSRLSYNFEINESFENSRSNFNIGAGPVFFINKSIAIETGIYYNYSKFENYNIHNIYMGAGFNLHLDRNTKK